MTVPVRWLTDQLAVTGQIDPTDIPSLQAMGFKSVICNRPDHEFDTQQPTANAIQLAAEAAGMKFSFLPVPPDGGTAADAQSMGQLLGTVDAPVLAYCKTGGRCMALIGLAARLGHTIP